MNSSHEQLTRIKKGNDLGDDESKDPCNEQDAEPAGPSHKSVAIHVHRVAKHAEEDKTSRDRSIQTSKENQCRNHEGEGSLFVNGLQGSKSGGRNILVASICVDDCANNGEDDDFGNGAGPERLGEFPASDLISIRCEKEEYK